MKDLSGAMAAHLVSGATTLAWAWRITRADGAVYGFTDHDAVLTFGGTVFEPDTGLMPTEIRAASDLGVDSQEGEGVLSSDGINETDILDGRWDNAAVEVWRVNWADPTERVLMRRGNLGQVRRGRLSFVAEMRSMAHLVGQSVGRVYQSNCDVRELGDSRCKVVVEDPAYTAVGAVVDPVRDRSFTTSGLGAFAVGWFSKGKLSWVSGSNIGREARVLLHDLVGGAVQITLLDEPARAISGGDGFEISAGCDRAFETCRDKFNNLLNFRGFPDIPGQKSVMRYASQGAQHDGNVL